MRRGDIYPIDRAERALANFFRRGNLIALREMALQRVTRAVDRTLDDYVQRKHLGPHFQVVERVMVSVSASRAARDLIARGARLAQAVEGEFFIVHLDCEADKDPERARILDDNLQFAANLDAKIIRLKGKSVALATAEFAKANRITQAIFGRSPLRGLKKYLYFREIARFVTSAPHVDLHIITQENR
jgi:two-component system sensor histidine kinase KdpD